MTPTISFTIGPITPDRFPAWRQLRLRALKDHPDAFGRSYESYAALSFEEASEEFFSRRPGRGPDSETYGAFDADGKILGAAGVFRESGEKERHRMFLWGMYVAPEARGTGVADALVDALLDFSRSLDGVLQVHLAVTAHNHTARRLYERHGFKRYGTDPRTLFQDGTFLDEDLMVRFLDRD
jgi:RimJ/RimL family protein N-acetyltransferase